MKKLFFCALIFLSQPVFADQYFYVDYLAYPKLKLHQHIFQKGIIHMKGDAAGNSMDLIKNDYLAFIKRKHPEYFKEYINGLPDDEFHIKAAISVNGWCAKESQAKSALESSIKELRKRYEDTKNTGSVYEVVEVDDYVYGGP